MTQIPAQILSEARRRGIELRAVKHRLFFRSPQTVPSELLSAIRTHRAEILEALLHDDSRSISPKGLVDVEKLKAAEAAFTCLDHAPKDVVLCVSHPERDSYWVAYRRTDRTRQGTGDSQADAVMMLEPDEEGS